MYMARRVFGLQPVRVLPPHPQIKKEYLHFSALLACLRLNLHLNLHVVQKVESKVYF
jgi:hypothetical protein